eukprot:g16668.t1
MPTRGPASSPAGVRKGGALSRAIARQNGKRQESAARARDSPASDTASFGGRSSPPSEKPGPVFQPPSRPPIGEPIGEKTGEIGLQKAKSVSVVLDEPSGCNLSASDYGSVPSFPECTAQESVRIPAVTAKVPRSASDAGYLVCLLSKAPLQD